MLGGAGGWAGPVLVAGVVAVAVLAWAGGEVAGRLLGGRFPAVSVTAAGRILLGLVSHPAHPALAWPAAVRPLVPGPVAYYPVAAALAASAVVLAGVGARWWRRAPISGPRRGGPWSGSGPGRGQVPPPRGSSWARSRDLGRLVVPGPTAGRLSLGRCGRRHLAAEAGQSVIVVGPTQTHKTSGFAVPAILEWDGPVVATSVKTDLVRDTIGWREALGQVWVYDPTATTGLPATGWSPLASCGSWVGARRTAAALCGAARTEASLPDADFWYATAAKLLAPLLLAAACSGRTMGDVVRWVDLQEVEEVEAVLGGLDAEEAVQAARASWQREDRQRSSVYTTAETVVDAFADPAVSAAPSQVDPGTLLDGGAHTLFVCAPAHEQRRLRPAFTTLVSEVLVTAYERAGQGGRPLEPPLLVVLDEAANVAPLADLDGLAATAASHGVQLVTVWQDLAQVAARYGHRAATVVNNHRAKIVLSGISDPATLDQMSALVGDEEVAQSSTTTGPEGKRSTTRSVSPRRLAPSDALRRIRPGEGVLVYGHLPPARLRLRPWFGDRRLAARAGAATLTGPTGEPAPPRAGRRPGGGLP